MKTTILIPLLFLLIMFPGCSDDDDDGPIDPFYREAMRQFVINIRTAADSLQPGFLIIPQNGHDILQDTNGPALSYIAAINGAGQEDLFFGYNADNTWTPRPEREALITLLNTAKSNGIRVLVTDYVSTPSLCSLSLSSNDTLGFASFQAPDRELRTIPTLINHENSLIVSGLQNASNFLYLLNPEYYADRNSYLIALSNSTHDLLIIDAFYDGTILTAAEMEQIHFKPGSGNRKLVIAYMSIGEAEDYRYYWQSEWSSSPPSWLAGVNPEWAGNYKVRYWYPEWQSIICNTTNSYLKKLTDAGFDGAYLDIIEAFEYFE